MSVNSYSKHFLEKNGGMAAICTSIKAFGSELKSFKASFTFKNTSKQKKMMCSSSLPQNRHHLVEGPHIFHCQPKRLSPRSESFAH